MKVRAQQQDTIDALCWRHLGVTAGVVEKALQLNPGIAKSGAFIPHGQVVILPDPPTTTATVPTIQLWD